MPPSRLAAQAPQPPAHQPDAVAALRRRVFELERRSGLDRLTGLWTRSYFARVVGREIAFSEWQHVPLSLVLIGADRVPETGTGPDEAVPRAMAALLLALSRPTDLLFRWGAAELALLAPATSAAEAKSFAERARARVSSVAFPAVGRITFSAAAGEHHFGEGGDPWAGRVVASLQAARAAGGNRVVVAAGGASELWSARPPASALRLVWSGELVSGNELLDTQHGALFDAANTLLAAMTDGHIGTPAILEQVDCLIAALGRHFSDEEILLAEVKYPDLTRHHRMHERLMEGARRLRGSLASGVGTPGQVVEFLAYDVVNRHFLKEDNQYFPFVAGHRSGMR